MKAHRIETIAEAVDTLGIDPTRFRILLRTPNEDILDRPSDDERKRLGRRSGFSLSNEEGSELCAFTRETIGAIEDAIDVEDVIERRTQVPAGDNVQDYLDEFELVMFEARGTLSVIAKMCEVAETHDLGMEVL